MQQTGLEHKLPVYASHIARTTGAGHHAQLLVEMGGLLNFLPGLALNFDPPDHFP
jgi:hypothetical protein